MNQNPSGIASAINCGCSLVVLVIILSGAFFLFNRVCSKDASESEYLNEFVPIAQRYNLARDVLEDTVREADSVMTVAEGIAVGRKGVSDLEIAIQDMNNAYKELADVEATEKYRTHQTHTLAAWRSSVEAAVAFKLYLEGWLISREVDDSLILEVNRLFREEDMHRLEAHRVFEDAR